MKIRGTDLSGELCYGLKHTLREVVVVLIANITLWRGVIWDLAFKVHGKFFKAHRKFQICPEKISDLSRKIFRFVREDFKICPWYFLDSSGKVFRFVRKNFQICQGKGAKDKVKMPEGQKAGPKCRQLEVGAQRAPRLLVWYTLFSTTTKRSIL